MAFVFALFLVFASFIYKTAQNCFKFIRSKIFNLALCLILCRFILAKQFRNMGSSLFSSLSRSCYAESLISIETFQSPFSTQFNWNFLKSVFFTLYLQIPVMKLANLLRFASNSILLHTFSTDYKTVLQILKSSSIRRSCEEIPDG